MPVTPTPQTLQIDLSEEYLDFLEMASQRHGLSPQDIIRKALTMLKHADPPVVQLLEALAPFPGSDTSDLNKACLAAWDRWSEDHGQQLPLSDELAAFVDEQVAQGVAREPTGVVMLALLYYARIMDFLPNHDEDE